jgi:CRP/FNR family transcriptional regulator, cyclic AMP receptor protein
MPDDRSPEKDLLFLREVSIVHQQESSTVGSLLYEDESARHASQTSTQVCLKEASVHSLLRGATPYTARSRQVIHYEGRPTTGVYFVESGHIKCTSTASDGRELLLCEFGAGEFLGLIEALSRAPAVATAVATETSILKRVRKELFRSLVANDSELALALARVLAQRLRLAYEHSTALAYEPIERRVLRTLGKLACSCDGTIVVDRALSITELASRVAASRTRVSLAVQDLIRRGQLSRINGKFVLPSEAQPAATLRK